MLALWFVGGSFGACRAGLVSFSFLSLTFLGNLI